MAENIIINRKENPVLLDRIIQDIQDSLCNRLNWLDKAFGRAYKLVEHGYNGDKLIYPAAYIGKSEYVSLLPNDNFGNFMWFDIYDPQNIDNTASPIPQFSFTGALVFWYDASTIYNDDSVTYTEEIKDEIIRVLMTPGLLKQGRLTINKIYERFENIYKGYSVEKMYTREDIDKQFFMHPYAGVRIEFEIITRELCQQFIR